MKKLAIVTTHPIQYYAPVFKLLQQRGKIAIRVFYTAGEDFHVFKHDPGFGKDINWDIPLLDGYNYQWAKNIVKNADTRSFSGIETPALPAEIETWHPDAVLVIGWASKSHLQVLRHFKNKIPVLFRGDSTLLVQKNGMKRFLRYLWLSWVYSHVDHAFYVGKNNKAYFRKYGLKERQLTFGPHAIDNERFGATRAEEFKALRMSLNIDDEILIVYAGKFEPVKNVGLLLEAFIKLNSKDVRLLLVGNGPDEEALKSRAQNSIAADRIHFTGFKNQSFMPVLYQAADIFCLPSKSESWGLAINEAMAGGCAILTSDKVGCAADLVMPGDNGYTFKEGDVNELVAKLQDIIRPKERLATMGQRSKDLIKDWDFLHLAMAIEHYLEPAPGLYN